MTVTVYHMLECHDMSVMPLDALSNIHDDLLQRDSDPHEWCLFSIEVRNTYGLPFEVTFDRTQRGEVESPLFREAHSSKQMRRMVLHVRLFHLARRPGKSNYGFSPYTKANRTPSNRFLLPIRRFRLSDDVISRPIPTLSDRQFVVSKSSLSDAEDKAQRELFWYREELLDIIHGHWKEVNLVKCSTTLRPVTDFPQANGSRSGDLSLRQQHMTAPMLKALETDLTRIDLSLVQCCPEETTVRSSGGKFIVTPNTVMNMVIKVTNTGRMSIMPVFLLHINHTSASTLALMLNLSTSPEEHVLLQGSLTDIAMGHVGSGQSQVVEVPLCFLSLGYFGIAVEARQLGIMREKQRTGVARLWAVIKEDNSMRTTFSDL